MAGPMRAARKARDGYESDSRNRTQRALVYGPDRLTLAAHLNC
jgi:hypothetical protein